MPMIHCNIFTEILITSYPANHFHLAPINSLLSPAYIYDHDDGTYVPSTEIWQNSSSSEQKLRRECPC